MTAIKKRILDELISHPNKRVIDIAKDLGCSATYVSALRTGHHKVPHMEIPAQVMLRYEREARRRGILVETLMRGIIDTVAKDDLFSAVIDTEGS